MIGNCQKEEQWEQIRSFFSSRMIFWNQMKAIAYESHFPPELYQMQKTSEPHKCVLPCEERLNQNEAFGAHEEFLQHLSARWEGRGLTARGLPRPP